MQLHQPQLPVAVHPVLAVVVKVDMELQQGSKVDILEKMELVVELVVVDKLLVLVPLVAVVLVAMELL